MKYYGSLKPIISRNKPRAYIVKHGYHEVMKRLKANGISYSELIADTTIRVCRYRILNYETSDLPYEKHYLHSRTKFEADTLNVHFLKGDYLIEMGSRYDRLLVELLEPDGPDSYFNWNFFDAILQQKEWYSAYVFEDKAAKYLASDSKLKHEFDSMKLYAPGFIDNPGWQLYWVYQHSLHYEKEHMILPVFRIE
jgi:hypothetical protein